VQNKPWAAKEKLACAIQTPLLALQIQKRQKQKEINKCQNKTNMQQS